MDTTPDLLLPPAKRRKSSPPPRSREIGVMRKPAVDQDHASATFLGSSSGIHFIRVVYNAFARRSAHLNLTQKQCSPDNENQNQNLVPGEDDQLLHQSPQYEPSQAVSNELWMNTELDLRTSTTPKPSFENLVQWTRTYFDNWHPMFPFLLGPSVLEILERLSRDGWSRLRTTEIILLRSMVSISLLDRRQAKSQTKLPAVPPALVFRTVDQALESLHTLFCDPPTIPILQAAFSIQLFLVSLLRLNAASRVGGTIVRTAFHLGLHRCPARFPCFGAEDAAVRRRLFWSVYCLDRYLSQALGIPLGIRDDDVDVCYPGCERHGEVGVDDFRLRLTTHLAKFARVRGLIVELRNKSILHSRETAIDATQVNGELTHWWNEVYDDVYPVEHGNEHDGNDGEALLSTFHRLLLLVLRHESIICMNRPLLAAESNSSPEYRTALQVCIESSRSLITALRQYVVPGESGSSSVPLVWPSFTWAVWMSCLILVYAAWEGEFPGASASRYAKTGLSILSNLSRRGSTWPQTCIEAIRDLDAALSEPATRLHSHKNPDPGDLATYAPGVNVNGNNTTLEMPPVPEWPLPDPEGQGPWDCNANTSMIFGDGMGLAAADVDSGIDMWTVADGPWLIQEGYEGGFPFLG